METYRKKIKSTTKKEEEKNTFRFDENDNEVGTYNEPNQKTWTYSLIVRARTPYFGTGAATIKIQQWNGSIV